MLISQKCFFNQAADACLGICSPKDIMQTFLENVITFVRMWLFLKTKILLIQEKPAFFRKRSSLRMRDYAEIFHAISFYSVTLSYSVQQVSENFLNAFHTKIKLFQYLIRDMELLKKIFPGILDTKNANKVQKNFFIIVRKTE